MPPPGIRRPRFRDRQEHIGHPSGDQLHRQPRRPAQPGAALIEQKAVAGEGDLRHPGDARGQPAEKAGDWRMGMHQIRLFRPHQRHQGAKGADMRHRRKAALERQPDDAKALGTNVVQQWALGADADDFVPAVPGAAHQGQQEMPQGEVHVGDFQDFHGWGFAPSPRQGTVVPWIPRTNLMGVQGPRAPGGVKGQSPFWGLGQSPSLTQPW